MAEALTGRMRPIVNIEKKLSVRNLREDYGRFVKSGFYLQGIFNNNSCKNLISKNNFPGDLRERLT